MNPSEKPPHNPLTFSTLTQRIGGDGIDAWELHSAGMQRKRAGEDILILSIGEDVASTTPAPIVDAAVEALHNGLHHYAPLAGTAALRERLACQHTVTTSQPVNPDNVVVFAGAQNALFSVALCLLNKGDEVIFIEPCYSTYPATFSAGGATLVRIQARSESNFLPDIDQIRSAICDSTRLLVLNSPNNPTGVVYPQGFIQAVAQLCLQHNIWLLSDEVYANFTFVGEHMSPAGFFDHSQQSVVVSSLSKSHLMSGWRLGWAVCPVSLAKRLTDLILCMNYGVPLFIQSAACTALDQPASTVTDHVALYAERAALVVDRLSQINAIRFTPPKSGMFVMFDVHQLGLTANTFAHKLLADYGVCLLPCDGFGQGLSHHLRMSLCAERRDLVRACDAIAALARSVNT